MSPELTAILAAIYAANARILGMQAENMQRAAVGSSMAYPETEFAYYADELDRLSTAARNAS